MRSCRTIIMAFNLFTAALLTASCSGSDSAGVSTPPSPPVEQLFVTISPKRDTLLLGTSRTFLATVTNAAGLARSVPVAWTALDPTIATVNNGNVTAIGTGETRLVARAGSAVDTATLVVAGPQVELRVSPSAVYATLGDTIEFEATIVGPSGARTQTGGITWVLSDSGAAKLVGDGVMTTVAEGELQVIAQVGTISAAASVKIVAAPVASIAILPSNISLSVGEEGQLRAELRDGTGRILKGNVVTWSSSNASVVAVDETGAVRAKAKGGSIITAAAGGKTATAAVNVSSAPAGSVTISLPSDSLGTGRSMQATAAALTADGRPLPGRPMAWQSSNPAVATINSSGMLNAIIAGQTTISVICDGKVASQRLTVAVPVPKSVAVVPATALLLLGTTSAFSAEVRDQFGVLLVGQSVTWSSTAPAVATVSTSGLVTTVSLGASIVKATSGSLGGTAAVTVQNVSIASIVVSPAAVSVAAGASATLTATAFDASGNVLSQRPVTWTSSNTAIATVSVSGVVTGVTPGVATISATAEGKVKVVNVTVTAPLPPPVSSITITFNSSTLSVGQSTTAVAREYDVQGNELFGRVVTFTSANPALATVSAAGVVTAKSAGSATIVATSEGQAGYGSVTIQPTPPAPVATVTLTAPNSTLVVGDSVNLVVTLRDSTGAILTGRTISFNTSNSAVVSVAVTGRVLAIASGSATLSVTSEGKSATLAFTVRAVSVPPVLPVPVATVVVTLNASTIRIGQGTQGTAVLRDSASALLTGRTIAWSSSSTAVATVSQTGYVTGVAQGAVTITAQSEGKTDGAVLTVQIAPAVVASVQVTLAPATIVVGGSAQVTAVARDSSGAAVIGRSVGWSIASGSLVATLGASTTSTNTVTGRISGSTSVIATIDGVTSSAAVTVTPAPPVPPSSVALPVLPTLISFSYPSVTGRTWSVNAGDNLQAALNGAQRGDEIVLQAGATFTGNFVLPVKSGTTANGWILVRSDKSVQLPRQSVRVTAANESLMPKIVTPNTAAALATAPRTSGWWITGVELTVAPAVTAIQYGIVQLGDNGANQSTLAQVPSDLVLDRVYVHGQTTTNTSRCVELNSARTAIQDSYLAECHGNGFDSQAILGWNGPGPFKIVNNTLMGAGENIMFGGADPSILNLVPSDIEIRGNYIYTPVSWKGIWTKKNLLELKNSRRVLIEGNVLDGSWADGQVGFAVLMRSSNQSGQCLWCVTEHVTMRYNIIRNAAGGFSLPGIGGNFPSTTPLSTVLIEQNILENISVPPFIGDGKMVQISGGVSNLTIRNNTMSSTSSFKTYLALEGVAINVDYRDNLVGFGTYGICGSGFGCGESVIGNILRGTVNYSGTVIVGTTRPGFPLSRFVPDLAAGRALGAGANESAVQAATAGVAIP